MTKISKQKVLKLIEQIREYLKENPLKGWAYIHSRKLSEEEVALLQIIWPSLETWKTDSKLLQQGAEMFEYRIEKELNKIRGQELKKLCEELFK